MVFAKNPGLELKLLHLASKLLIIIINTEWGFIFIDMVYELISSGLKPVLASLPAVSA